MLFVLTGEDRPGALDARLAARPDHLAHWQGLGEALKLAGPFLDENGDPAGSLVVFEAEDIAAARALAEADPYVTRGILETHAVRPWRWAINNPPRA